VSGPLNPALLSASAAICGSLVGALSSAIAAAIAQRQAGRRTLLATEIAGLARAHSARSRRIHSRT
jgi:hypothetical protein